MVSPERLPVDIRPEGAHTPVVACRPEEEESERIALLQGTLDLLILKVLQLVPVHGQGIARASLRQSDEAFFVDHGSLYLALQRLEDNGLITAEWGVSRRKTIARRASTPAHAAGPPALG